MLDAIMGHVPPIFFLAVGTVMVIISVFRHVAKRRQFGDSYTRYIREVKFKPYSETNEFGQRVKWIVEDNEPDRTKTTESPESPAGSGS